MVDGWGDRRIDEIRATDVEALRRHTAATAIPERDGRAAAARRLRGARSS